MSTNMAPYDQILSAVNKLFEPGQVVELRVIFRNKQRIDSGYFNDFEALAFYAEQYERVPDAISVYITLNPVDPKLLGRAENKVI